MHTHEKTPRLGVLKKTGNLTNPNHKDWVGLENWREKRIEPGCKVVQGVGLTQPNPIMYIYIYKPKSKPPFEWKLYTWNLNV